VSVFSRLRNLFRRDAAFFVRDTMMFAGRARLIVHLFEEWGEEASSEFVFPDKPPGFDPLLVFQFAPWGDRKHWTYATAGLSLCPAMDEHPPTELIAYAEEQALGLIDLLHQLSFKEDRTVCYLPGDIVSFESDPPDLGIPMGRHYRLLPAPERAALMRFPELDVRREDMRYTLARPNEDTTQVQFLRVVALEDADPARWDGVRDRVEGSRVWKLW
jgi:hypothetical protein